MVRTVISGARGLVLASLLSGCGSPASGERQGEPSRVQPQPRDARTSAEPAVAEIWAEHSSERCGFSVQLPSVPLRQPTPPGLLDQIATEDIVGQVAMIASCGDVPSVGSPDEFLEVTSSVIAGQLHATVDRRAELEQQGRPGLELWMTVPAADKPPTITWPGDLAYRLRLYVAGTRQYQVHMLHPSTAEVDAMAERFFDSFTLLDDAPAAAEPLVWSVHTVAGLKVEAPGQPRPIEAETPGLVASVQFGREGRTTPYALSVWTHEVLGALEDPTQRLRAHFVLRVATEHTEILGETPGQLAGQPTLDLVYRPNLPLPDHIAPQDAKTREAVEDLIERAPSEFRMRLVLVGDRIVQLLVADAKDDQHQRFFDSLVIPSPGDSPDARTDRR